MMEIRFREKKEFRDDSISVADPSYDSSKRRLSSRGSLPGISRMIVYGLAMVGVIDLVKRVNDGDLSSLLSEGLSARKLLSTIQQPYDTKIRDSLLAIEHITAETVWENLLQEASALLQESSQKRMVAIEVGMHKAHQCVQAAKAGLIAHCLEPSPKNFQRVQTGVRNRKSEAKGEIHLYQKAAGAKTGIMLDFSATGGTGDHVGEFDVWNMKVGTAQDENLLEKMADQETVQVSSIKVDDIIQNAVGSDEERVFIVKIDTQGFEPSVFSGLDESVFQKQRVDFILFEYWPKGMDLLASTGEAGSDHTKACIAAALLEELQLAGYTLYALPNTSHPQAPRVAKGALKNERAPLDNARDNCEYYYELEQRFPSDDYKMGYWSDILAVAPTAKLIQSPITPVGAALMQQEPLAIPSIRVS